MKKLLILIALLPSSFLLKAQTNVYHPFPDSNAVWIVKEWGINPDSPLSIFKYSLGNDTIINATSYIQLNRIGNCLHCYNAFSDTCYIGGIRQDTLKKTVYIIFKDSLMESLLFDFSLKAGDKNTLPSIGGYDFAHANQEVLYIDSVLIAGNYRRQIVFSPPFGEPFDYFIEGIGSNAGLMEPSSGFEAYFELNCFIQNDTISFCPTVGINENLIANKIVIYPNPFSTKLNVRIEGLPATEKLSVKIYNFLGQEQSIRQVFYKKNIELDMTILYDGIYFLVIYEKNKLLKTEKIIKITK